MTVLDLVTIDPEISHGQACIKGTRIPVSVILGCLADGLSEAEIVAEYPTLKIDGVRAAAAYGALLATEQVLPLTTDGQ
jgi:uncharacterized protein (DUF433 family)